MAFNWKNNTADADVVKEKSKEIVEKIDKIYINLNFLVAKSSILNKSKPCLSLLILVVP